MSEKVPARPAWYKNTYFWIAAALFLLAILALARGAETIRDPGQKHEGGLAWWYLLASVLMYVNGWLSHRQTVRAYQEVMGDTSEPARAAPETPKPKEVAAETPESEETQ